MFSLVPTVVISKKGKVWVIKFIKKKNPLDLEFRSRVKLRVKGEMLQKKTLLEMKTKRMKNSLKC